ncbi:hypothetical protein Efla_007175 [Eimeria flavescens]
MYFFLHTVSFLGSTPRGKGRKLAFPANGYSGPRTLVLCLGVRARNHAKMKLLHFLIGLLPVLLASALGANGSEGALAATNVAVEDQGLKAAEQKAEGEDEVEQSAGGKDAVDAEKPVTEIRRSNSVKKVAVPAGVFGALALSVAAFLFLRKKAAMPTQPVSLIDWPASDEQCGKERLDVKRSSAFLDTVCFSSPFGGSLRAEVSQ